MMQMRALFFLLLLSTVIVDESVPWRWVKRAWNWAKKAAKKVGGWYNKHKHWINPLVKAGAHAVSAWDNLATLRDEDHLLYSDFMESLEKDLREQFGQDMADDVVQGMDEFLDIASDSASDIMRKIARVAKQHDDNGDLEDVGQVIASHLNALE